MAPETLTHNPIYGLNIFSFGCTVLHLVTEHPTEQFISSGMDTNVFKKVSEVERRKEAIINSIHTSSLQLIVLWCLHDEPPSRPDISVVCTQLTNYINKLETQSPTLAQ